MGLLSVNDTGEPDNTTQRVKGSLPIFSDVKPWVSVTGPGRVTGSGSVHILPEALTTTPVIVPEEGSNCQLKFGLHASLVIRAWNEAARSSCL